MSHYQWKRKAFQSEAGIKNPYSRAESHRETLPKLKQALIIELMTDFQLDCRIVMGQ